MSTRDIQRHLQQVYGVEVSPETISNITESVMADVREWQTRPLEKSYPILFLDALRVNSRQDGKNVNKALYVALAINWEGRKEVLGLWLADTEGAKFLMSVLTDIKNRGTEDILIACMDGLTGFPDAVKAVFPDTSLLRLPIKVVPIPLFHISKITGTLSHYLFKASHKAGIIFISAKACYFPYR